MFFPRSFLSSAALLGVSVAIERRYLLGISTRAFFMRRDVVSSDDRALLFWATTGVARGWKENPRVRWFRFLFFSLGGLDPVAHKISVLHIKLLGEGSQRRLIGVRWLPTLLPSLDAVGFRAA